MGVDIPDNFSIWNKLGMFGQKDAIRQQWTAHFPDAEKASHCVRCGKCEAVCPQHLPIRDSLAKLQTATVSSSPARRSVRWACRWASQGS